MPQVQRLAKENGLSIPEEGTIILVEDEGEVKAFMNIRVVAFAEPMVSKTPFASRMLFDHVSSSLKRGGHKILRAFVEDKNSGLLKKLGFNRVFEDHQSFEKIL